MNFLGDEDIATDDRGVFVVTGLGPNEEYGITVPRANEPLKTIRAGDDGINVDLGTIDMH